MADVFRERGCDVEQALEYRERYLGVRIPRTNLQPEHLGAARGFAKELADTLTPASAG